MTKFAEIISKEELDWLYIKAGIKQLNEKETKRENGENKTPDDEKTEG